MCRLLLGKFVQGLKQFQVHAIFLSSKKFEMITFLNGASNFCLRE